MTASAPYERAVGVLTRDHEMHRHSTLDHHAKQLADTFVRREVWILDDDLATRTRDRNRVEQCDRRDRVARGATHDMGIAIPCALQQRKAAVSCRHDMRFLDPIFHEYRLQGLDRGAFDTNVGVTPMVFVFAITEPLIRD